MGQTEQTGPYWDLRFLNLYEEYAFEVLFIKSHEVKLYTVCIFVILLWLPCTTLGKMSKGLSDSKEKLLLAPPLLFYSFQGPKTLN